MEIFLVLESCDEQTAVHSGWLVRENADAVCEQVQDAATNADGDCYSWYSVYPLTLCVFPPGPIAVPPTSPDYFGSVFDPLLQERDDEDG
jgi:hypothetical protein